MRKKDVYKQRAEMRKEGVLGYPFYLIHPLFGKYVPTIQKGKEVQITATTDAGKSKFWRAWFLMDIYLLWKKGLTPNFKPKFIINLLEDTKEEFEDALYSAMIYRITRKNITTTRLNSLDETELTEIEFQLVDKAEPFVEELLSFCFIFDNTYNATGLYKNARRVLLQHGTRDYLKKNTKDIFISQEEWNKLHFLEKENYIPKRYVPNDPNDHWFVITDYINLIEGELSTVRVDGEKKVLYLNERDSISKWIFDYGKKILQKHFRVTSINIIQQMSETEKKQFDYMGKNVIEKLKPSRNGYGENKVISRAAQLILGIFDPAYYGITNYQGYDLRDLNTNYRSLLILKNKLGKGSKEFPLFFNGAADYFCEMPLPDTITTQDTQKVKNYQYYKKI